MVVTTQRFTLGKDSFDSWPTCSLNMLAKVEKCDHTCVLLKETFKVSFILRAVFVSSLSAKSFPFGCVCSFVLACCSLILLFYFVFPHTVECFHGPPISIYIWSTILLSFWPVWVFFSFFLANGLLSLYLLSVTVAHTLMWLLWNHWHLCHCIL